MTTNTSNRLRAPLQLARGLGSAKHGTEHWWAQRLTAMALVPLCLWFVLGVIIHMGADHAEFVAWMKSPYSATMMVLTVGLVFHHAQAGMQVVYEDYIHHELVKVAAIVLTKFLCFALAAACIVSVLKLTFGA